ncbi:helix-turn-helix domain-containing protein [Streptomyces sp. NPDC102360]|uniref:helix-turn-helix domain-containing protein n=1 Tax=Streptomyces sp. NPDC102360 TaxID=3366160 RepID=UPI0037FCA1F0
MPGVEKQSALAQRLDRLFEEIRPEGSAGRRYTHDEVAVALHDIEPGVRVSGAYLSALRNGTKRNPSLDLLTVLAQFFGVSVSYFLDPGPDEQVEDELDLARVGHHPQVRNLALRALELSPEGLAIVTQIVEHVLTTNRAQGVAELDAEVPDRRSE